jgi:hypothetical protein
MAEVLRIVVPLIGFAIILAVLIGMVRGRSAAREQALAGLAGLDGLKYTPGRKDFFQGSFPGKVRGSYRGRNLTLDYRDDPIMTRQGYKRASYSAVVEMAIQNPNKGSLMLKPGRKSNPQSGDFFDQRITVTSKPNAFAPSILVDPALRQRLALTLTQDWKNPGKINVVRTGSLIFSRDGFYSKSEQLVALLDLLSDLAGVVETC